MLLYTDVVGFFFNFKGLISEKKLTLKYAFIYKKQIYSARMKTHKGAIHLSNKQIINVFQQLQKKSSFVFVLPCVHNKSDMGPTKF